MENYIGNPKENETQKTLDIGIDEDKPQVSPKRVLIENLKLENVSFGTDESQKLVLVCKHPDLQDPLELSSAKYEKDGKIKVSGLWIKLTNKDLLPYHSAVAHVLRHLGKAKITDLKGEQVDTVLDDRGYLAVKAY